MTASRSAKPLADQHWVVAIGWHRDWALRGIFEPVATAMVEALRHFVGHVELGHVLDPCDQLLAFAVGVIPPEVTLPPNAIVFNLEQIDALLSPNVDFVGREAYLQRLLAHRIWDYSAANVAALRGLGADAMQVPIGAMPSMSNLPQPRVQDIDVLFYGSTNPRRNAILDALEARGAKVSALFGVYGDALDDAIARAKVVLNMHYYDAHVLEIVRLAPLLANRKAVVCEASRPDPAYDALLPGMACVPYEQLVDACLALLRDDAARAHVTRRGFEVFAACDQRAAIAAALGVPAPPPWLPPPSGLPDTLQWVRSDDSGSPHDAGACTLDLAAPLPWNQPWPAAEFSGAQLQDHLFEHIVAHDVLQHAPDWVAALHNAMRLLRPGARLSLTVPHALSRDAGDATHRFTEATWQAFNDGWAALYWGGWRLDCQSVALVPSDLGRALLADGATLDTLARTPHAVQAMHVTLFKRHLTTAEQAQRDAALNVSSTAP